MAPAPTGGFIMGCIPIPIPIGGGTPTGGGGGGWFISPIGSTATQALSPSSVPPRTTTLLHTHKKQSDEAPHTFLPPFMHSRQASH